MSIVFNCSSDIEGITGDSLAEMVREYQTWEGGNELSQSSNITDKVTHNGITANFAKSSYSDLKQDYLDGDFTINSLYFNLQDLSVIDPLGYGLTDV
jgi:hypothetical protein